MLELLKRLLNKNFLKSSAGGDMGIFLHFQIYGKCKKEKIVESKRFEKVKIYNKQTN